MPSAGELLRQERLKRNRSIADLARETRISVRYLEALEANQVGVFPGDFFYRSFLKQYTEALRLDPEITTQVIASAEPVTEHDPIPAMNAAYEVSRLDSKLSKLSGPSALAAVLLLFVVLAAGSALFAFWGIGRAPDDSESTTTSTPAPADTSAAVAPAPAEPLTSPPGQVDISVDLAAKEQTWVSLSSEGKTLFAGLLGASETKTFAVADGAKLMTGNAAGIDVRWKGRPIGPIGPRGTVRTVVFGSDKFEILPPQVKTGT